MKVTLSDLVFIGLLSLGIASGQVCSPPGQLCTRTTDCCKGCCEANTCVERAFSCSPDLVSQPGFGSCIGHFCAVGHICYLRKVCPPENPCPPQPSCRKVDSTFNHTGTSWQQVPNSHPGRSVISISCNTVIAILIIFTSSNIFL